MTEHDALVGSYQHLENLPRAADALHTLRKISSLIKPIMRKRGWHVGVLKEFFPAQNNLLGLNVDHGRSICLRLRHAGDKDLFLPLEDVVDTMLHELSHNVHGPHNEQFHALWNELRDEYMDLKLKGYSGEGFLSDGQRLGGRRVPVQEMHRHARIEAERRRALQALQKGSGQKLGGTPLARGTDMRNVIANAVTKRLDITKGCASGTNGADQVSKDADHNGFRTKAEEDDVNERAVAQALWELVQEEEARKAGVEPQHTSIPVDFMATARLHESAQSRENSNEHGVKSLRKRSASPPRTAPFGEKRNPPISSDTHHSRPISSSKNARVNQLPHRLISEDEARRRNLIDLTSSGDEGSKSNLKPTANLASDRLQSSSPITWTCKTCTLVNPINFLCCDACRAERPATLNVDYTGSENDLGENQNMAEVKTKTQRLGWNCKNCGWWLEHKWWTCSNCGLMKDSSAP